MRVKLYQVLGENETKNPQKATDLRKHRTEQKKITENIQNFKFNTLMDLKTEFSNIAKARCENVALQDNNSTIHLCV